MAAIAATASFAQSSVVISGNLDVAYASRTGSMANANGTTVTTSQGNASTTGIKFVASEDLGGGLKAIAQFEFDPRQLIDDGLTLQQVSTAAGTQTVGWASTMKGLGQHEMFIGLSGGFGYLQLGSPNTFSLDTNSASSPLGTGIGSGYTVDAGAFSGWQTLAATRYARAVKYTTPVINGFSAGVQYAPGNDQSFSSNSAVLKVPNNRQATEIGLKYSMGNLNVSFANNSQAAQTNNVGYYNNATAALVSTSSNILGANYKFGNLTGYIGMGSGVKMTNLGTEQKADVSRFALKFDIDKVALIGQYTQASSSGSTAKITGARVDYNMSKTAAAYFGYEAIDNGATTANSLNTMAIGIRKSF